LTDYAATAAAVSALDLVLCVDTSVAHLAGALGRPAWVMLPHAPDWRWMLGRDDTPWYRSLRLFRQDRPGDWTSVIARVGAALARYAARGADVSPIAQ
jgi:ADP-heptose:LPS heptosyltransferase